MFLTSSDLCPEVEFIKAIPGVVLANKIVNSEFHAVLTVVTLNYGKNWHHIKVKTPHMNYDCEWVFFVIDSQNVI